MAVSAKAVEKESGFDCEFTKPPPKEVQTECRICLSILREPHLVSCCGNNFCRPCIGGVQKKTKTCPLCNGTDFSIVPNKGLSRTLNEFPVYCTLRGRGCEWVGELQKLDQHLNANPAADCQLDGCSWVRLKCLNGCGGIFQRRSIKDHQNRDCAKRSFSCEHCHEHTSTYEKVVEEHWPVCKCYPVSCPNKCGAGTVQRQNLKRHVDDECPHTLKDCEFSDAGCLARLPRRDMAAHLMDYPLHLYQLAKWNRQLHERLLEKDDEIRREMALLKKQNDELKGEIHTLEERIQRLRTEHDRKMQDLEKKLREEICQVEDKAGRQNKALREEIKAEIHQLREMLKTEIQEVKKENQTLREEIQRVSAEKEKKIGENQEEIRKVKDKEEQRNAVLTRECQVLRSHSRLGQFPIDVTMANFDQLKTGNSHWYSPPIYTNADKGYKLCLLVHPNGTDDGKGTHVSVSVCLMKGEFDDTLRWPLKCSVTVELLNQTSRDHIAKTIKVNNMARVAGGDRTVGRCENRFVPHSELVRDVWISSSYLRNDSLQFRVKM